MLAKSALQVTQCGLTFDFASAGDQQKFEIYKCSTVAYFCKEQNVIIVRFMNGLNIYGVKCALLMDSNKTSNFSLNG